tara:strand:+ start:74 stop:301 length:228 start_codon:yes stop_codon:yes gene_type:complete
LFVTFGNKHLAGEVLFELIVCFVGGSCWWFLLLVIAWHVIDTRVIYTTQEKCMVGLVSECAQMHREGVECAYLHR